MSLNFRQAQVEFEWVVYTLRDPYPSAPARRQQSPGVLAEPSYNPERNVEEPFWRWPGKVSPNISLDLSLFINKSDIFIMKCIFSLSSYLEPPHMVEAPKVSIFIKTRVLYRVIRIFKKPSLPSQLGFGGLDFFLSCIIFSIMGWATGGGSGWAWRYIVCVYIVCYWPALMAVLVHFVKHDLRTLLKELNKKILKITL